MGYCVEADDCESDPLYFYNGYEGGYYSYTNWGDKIELRDKIDVALACICHGMECHPSYWVDFGELEADDRNSTCLQWFTEEECKSMSFWEY